MSVVFGLFRLAAAHGDHEMEEKIADGAAMSVDPIVGTFIAWLVGEILTWAGLDIMDSHSADDAVFWHHLPGGHGSWCMYIRP